MSTITQTAAASKTAQEKVTTLNGLPLAANTPTPIPADVAAYYQNTLAKGSGPSGTYLTTDFFGSAAGIPYNDYLTSVTSTISAQLTAGTLTTLNNIYSYMKTLVSTNTYGVPPTITLPAPYNTPTYATYDAALSRLITEANAAIGTAITAMGTATTTLNTAWTAMVQHSANESTFQTQASIDYATLTAGAQLPITAFIPALAGYGQDRQVGMAFDFLTSIANTANQSGQAMVGALIEGGNKAGLESAGIIPDTAVPSQPNAVPPLVSTSQYGYTVAQARAEVQT
jgi:hypothetical protein